MFIKLSSCSAAMAVCLLSPLALAAPLEQTPSSTPSAAQKAQIARKYGFFCHHGINTYLDIEWSDGTCKPGIYAPPANLEEKIDTWVKTVHAAGMRYFLCITKHHDGFCLWDSPLTEYDVGNPEVKNNLNVVKAVAKACKKYGISFAMYYSLWDRHEPTYKDDKKYNDYMIAQLKDLMSNFGPVSELWLDGSWDKAPERWNLQEIYTEVKKLQPNCQISTNWTIGTPNSTIKPNEQQEGSLIRYFPSDFRLGDPELPRNPGDPKNFSHKGKSYYMPFESTVTVSSKNNWFFHASDPDAKSVDALEDAYWIATTQDNMLVLNIPPDKEGNLAKSQVDAVMSLAKRLNLGPGKPFPQEPKNLAVGATAEASSLWAEDGPTVQAQYDASKAVDGNAGTRWSSGPKGSTSATLEIKLPQKTAFNQVKIWESFPRTKKYVLEAGDGKEWKIISEGTTLGTPATLKFGQVNATSLRLKVLESTDAVSIAEVKVLDVK